MVIKGQIMGLGVSQMEVDLQRLVEVMVVQVDFILYKFKLQGKPDETH